MTKQELRDTAYELEKSLASNDFIEWARTWYGPKVAKIHIHTDSEYDDQGGYYDTIDSIDAYDEFGRELPVDLRSAGVWDEVKDEVALMMTDTGATEEEAINDTFEDMRWEWEVYEELDASYVGRYGHDIHIPSSTEDPVLPPIYVEETFDASTIFKH